MMIWVRKEGGIVCQVHYSTRRPTDSSPGTWSQVDHASTEVKDFESAQEARFAAAAEAERKRAAVLDWLARLTEQQRAKLVE